MTTNVLNTQLEDCCVENNTGFFGDGSCESCEQDIGQHTICARMTEDFLQFNKEHGNDLITPIKEFDFPGLKPGDKWCICLDRWIEALDAGIAPKIYLRSTHESVLQQVDLDILEMYAYADS